MHFSWNKVGILSTNDLSSSRTFSVVYLQPAFKNFGIVFHVLLVAQFSKLPGHIHIAAFVLQSKRDRLQSALNFCYTCLRVYQSQLILDVLFTSSACIECKALLISKNPRISWSVFCDAPSILTWISSAKDRSSISMYVSS